MKIVRENPDAIRKMLHSRNVDYPLDRLLLVDSERRRLVTENQNLKYKRNAVASEVSSLKKNKSDASAKILEMKKVSSMIEGSDKKIRAIDGDLRELLLQLPNIPHESVPDGIDENQNKVISVWGKIKSIKKPLDHMTLAENLDLIDIERASKVAGSRFYYLKGDLVRLNFALIGYAIDFMISRGVTLLQPPYALRREALEGSIIFSDFEEVVFKVEGEDLYLIATSEHLIAAMHMGEILPVKKFPIRYAGVSPCFRKEAGSHGKDTKGIFRVHQFEKVEQFSFTKPEESWNELERIVSNTQEMFRNLQLPHRLVLLCSGDLGKVSAKTYDIEVWLPGQGKYREAASCSNCTDYQSRALGIKYREKPHEESKFVHTLNGTLSATERTLIAIMENYQLDDGRIEVPSVLQPYAGNLKIIAPRKN